MSFAVQMIDGEKLNTGEYTYSKHFIQGRPSSFLLISRKAFQTFIIILLRMRLNVQVQEKLTYQCYFQGISLSD